MGLDISFVACPRDELSEVGEFRKVNALLHWVDNHVMAVSNCAYIPITKENLEKLQGTLNQLTTDNCHELFPTQEGFFYGSTDYNEHYWEDVADVKAWVDETTEQAVVTYAIEYPAYGQHRASNELRKQGAFISGGWVRSIWLRHDLENFKKRLKALEGKAAKEGIILNDQQIAALEKKKYDDESCGEIETAHPDYLGCQDTFYVGNLKGVGRIYQQTFIDSYSKVVHCKLYTTKTPITAADILNDKVLPFYNNHDLPMLRILTDRGTEYCGKVEHHDYQLYLAINDIDHTKTKAMSPQTNGICERFHKTILQEFYQITFRKKLYNKLEELQKDLDEWLDYYNNNRTHQGKMCCGRTPMQTLLDGKLIWLEKSLDQI